MNAPTRRIPLELEKPTLPVAPPLKQTTTDVAPATSGPVDVGDLQDKIMEVLKGCYDPEIPVNIVELGLIYDLQVQETGAVVLKMTLTSPACPAAGSLPPEIETKVKATPGVTTAKVDVVWEPPWTPERMSEAAKLQLGMF
jgi:FeS assembly SUF system protein